ERYGPLEADAPLGAEPTRLGKVLAVVAIADEGACDGEVEEEVRDLAGWVAGGEARAKGVEEVGFVAEGEAAGGRALLGDGGQGEGKARGPTGAEGRVEEPGEEQARGGGGVREDGALGMALELVDEGAGDGVAGGDDFGEVGGARFADGGA